MLRLMTNIDQLNRFSVEASGTILSGADAGQGTWVVMDDGEAALPAAGTAGAFQIFTEENRDGSNGWSRDVSATQTGYLTLIQGNYRAKTDKYAGTPAAGSLLGVNADGNLAVIDDGTGDTLASTATPVARCVKAAHTERHLWKDWTMIEFVTV